MQQIGERLVVEQRTHVVPPRARERSSRGEHGQPVGAAADDADLISRSRAAAGEDECNLRVNVLLPNATR